MLSSLAELIVEHDGSAPELQENYVEETIGDHHPQHQLSHQLTSHARKNAVRPTGILSTQDALKAAEHGNSEILAAYLHAGGRPDAVSRLHHMGWSLLHLATGCALIGGLTTSLTYRSRPEPDSPNGFANCVRLLLAAGADPNVTSKQQGYTPLIGACLSGDSESCRLLLKAGARLDSSQSQFESQSILMSESSLVSSTAGLEPPKSPFEAAKHRARFGEAKRREVLHVLEDPPKLLPRSPLDVSCKLLEYPEGDERERSVEVSWRKPPDGPGFEIQRYVVRGYADGIEIDVQRDAVGPGGLLLGLNSAKPKPIDVLIDQANLQAAALNDNNNKNKKKKKTHFSSHTKSDSIANMIVHHQQQQQQERGDFHKKFSMSQHGLSSRPPPGPRRDFCRNPVVDRGIALRQNLRLPDPSTASTLVHGLKPSVTYHFTVSCIARARDGELRESPPSLASKPLEIPNVEADDWNATDIIDKVLSYSTAPPVLVHGHAPRSAWPNGDSASIEKQQIPRAAHFSSSTRDRSAPQTNRSTERQSKAGQSQLQVGPTTTIQPPSKKALPVLLPPTNRQPQRTSSSTPSPPSGNDLADDPAPQDVLVSSLAAANQGRTGTIITPNRHSVIATTKRREDSVEKCRIS